MKKLYLSTKNKKLGGVRGGVAEYLNCDPTIVRIAFVILALLYGCGLLVYLIMWFIMPKEEEIKEEDL